jgi:polar amino acid transport system permease protein
MSDFLAPFATHWPEWSARLFRAAGNTALISIFGFLLASLLGALLALGLTAPLPALRRMAKAYVVFFRGVPLLVILFLIYFGLPGVGLVFDAMPAAIFGLGLCFAAQMAEVIRAGFLAIPKGQSEAAASVGLAPSQTFFSVILPQVLRVTAAPIVVTFVALLKDSSLASLITVKELVLEGRALATEFFLPLQIFICVGALYFCIALPLSLLARGLARRAAPDP